MILDTGFRRYDAIVDGRDKPGHDERLLRRP
jgi:hypothetical protein